jgi:hypothetical protein
MTEEMGTSVPHYKRSAKHLPLPSVDGAYENLPMLTVLSTLALHRLMLADAP